MIHALGYSTNDFDAARPGRLCRGRERWIEPIEMDGPQPMYRLVITGAQFTDDSARDALRGIPHSNIGVGELIAALFQGCSLLAFMEDGHPADIPDEADGVEVYLGHRAGGLVEEPMVRWHKPLSSAEEILALFDGDAEAAKCRGLLIMNEGQDVDENLLQSLFLFSGMSTLDSPPAVYQPSAIPELLETVQAVIVIHRDKHGPALGIYTLEPLEKQAELAAVCERHDSLLVDFAIPPMLARWDRALSDMRIKWMAERDDEFPVPPAPEPSHWERGRRDRRKAKAAPEAEATPAEE